jgi:hypothetical protein
MRREKRIKLLNILDHDKVNKALDIDTRTGNMEKLDLLETYSAVERLRLLLHMIRKRTAFIRCKQCRANIAKMSSVFSLHSSAGTSGAYVNEHGAVHHTTTIQETMDGAVVCLGSAETRDR